MPDASNEDVIAVDLADIWDQPGRKKLVSTLAWGDPVTVDEVTDSHVRIKFPSFTEQADGSIVPAMRTGYITPTKSSKIKPAEITKSRMGAHVLAVDFVDVQQGDGSVIETPSGRVILIDGGDNQLFARYLANRFRNTSLTAPKKIDAILVSHGDADHFSGLKKIFDSEKHKTKRKRLFIQPERVFHNGIVKRPSGGRKDTELFGPTAKKDGKLYITGLEESLLDVDAAEMNAPFKAWRKALKTWNERKPIAVFRRLAAGDDAAFDFAAENGIGFEVLGPIAETVGGKPALKFLRSPPPGPRVGHEALSTDDVDKGSYSASHTINGHSVIVRMTYGAFSYLFAGDLNDEAERVLTRRHNDGEISLTSEVFKVPHHGSADFSGAFLKAVAPAVSVISSGDESARKEYIHPRATLMGSLGKYSRLAEPLIFVTELVAFFAVRGWSRVVDAAGKPKGKSFFGFSRTAFGIVKTRTDGGRLLIYTNSGNLAMKEAYAYELDENGELTPAAVQRA